MIKLTSIWERVCECYFKSDVIMGAMPSQITSLTIVYSIIYSGADQRKYQSSASLAFVRGIHRWPVNSPRKVPVTRKMFPFDDAIMHEVKHLPGRKFTARAKLFCIMNLRIFLTSLPRVPGTNEWIHYIFNMIFLVPVKQSWRMWGERIIQIN